MLNAKHVRRINYSKRKRKKDTQKNHKIIPAKHKRELCFSCVTLWTIRYYKKDVLWVGEGAIVVQYLKVCTRNTRNSVAYECAFKIKY